MRLTFSFDPIDTFSVLALGMFDGVHTGHAWLLRTAREWGALENLPVVVCTFLRHPMTVLRPEAAPPMLSTVAERAARMARLKVDRMTVLPFDRKLMKMPPEKFVQLLVSRYKPRHVVVGFNYSFGQGGKGDAKLLKEMGKKLGFEVHVVSPVQVDGQTVSSTRVRQLLEQGDVEQAAKLLERPYSVAGPVVHGKELGRKLGFPTANVAVPKGKALPDFGIYVVKVKTKTGIYPAVASLGCHPTVPEGDITLEAYLLGWSGDLYDQRVQVKFLKYIRPEIKFENVEALKEQMARDEQAARNYFHENRS